jgi:hypothetical protein
VKQKLTVSKCLATLWRKGIFLRGSIEGEETEEDRRSDEESTELRSETELGGVDGGISRDGRVVKVRELSCEPFVSSLPLRRPRLVTTFRSFPESPDRRLLVSKPVRSAHAIEAGRMMRASKAAIDDANDA